MDDKYTARKDFICSKGYKLYAVAEMMGMSRTSFYLKLKGARVFSADEIKTLVKLLHMNKQEKSNFILFTCKLKKVYLWISRL